MGSIPWSERSAGKGNGNPLQYWVAKPWTQLSMRVCVCVRVRTRARTHIHTHTHTHTHTQSDLIESSWIHTCTYAITLLQYTVLVEACKDLDSLKYVA